MVLGAPVIHRARYVRGSQGGIHWAAMLRTLAMIVAVAVVLVPVVFWLGIHVVRDLARESSFLHVFFCWDFDGV